MVPVSWKIVPRSTASSFLFFGFSLNHWSDCIQTYLGKAVWKIWCLSFVWFCHYIHALIKILPIPLPLHQWHIIIFLEVCTCCVKSDLSLIWRKTSMRGNNSNMPKDRWNLSFVMSVLFKDKMCHHLTYIYLPIHLMPF